MKIRTPQGGNCTRIIDDHNVLIDNTWYWLNGHEWLMTKQLTSAEENEYSEYICQQPNTELNVLEHWDAVYSYMGFITIVISAFTIFKLIRKVIG